MKTLIWIAIGIAIGLVSWIPINMADRGDIPFGAAILAIVSTFVGAIIVLVAVVQWVRHSSVPR